jgi:ribosomal protein S18 acetylase RimI-like enzyme
MKYVVRHARKRDLKAIYSLYQNWRNEPKHGEIDYDLNSFKKYIGSPKVDLVVACEDKDVIGYLLAYDHENWGYVDSICVNPQYRRSGVGQALISGALALKKHWHVLELCYDQNDFKIAKFVKSVGFVSDKKPMIFRWVYKARAAPRR